MTTKKLDFRCLDTDMDIAESVMPGEQITGVSADNYPDLISQEEAVVVGGHWPSDYPGAILRLCETCGDEIALSPASARASHTMCCNCIRLLMEMQNRKSDDR